MVELMRCVDQWGRDIVLTQDRWDDHILPGHPQLRGNEAGVEQVLTDPWVVMHDEVFPDRENFYRPFTLPPPYDRAYPKVCVGFRQPAPGKPVIGFVVTAYTTSTIKAGETQKWS